MNFQLHGYKDNSHNEQRAQSEDGHVIDERLIPCLVSASVRAAMLYTAMATDYMVNSRR